MDQTKDEIIRSSADLPMLLDAKALQKLGFSRPMAYRLLNRKDFPVIQIGNRKIVPKEKFLDWLEKQIDDPDGYFSK